MLLTATSYILDSLLFIFLGYVFLRGFERKYSLFITKLVYILTFGLFATVQFIFSGNIVIRLLLTLFTYFVLIYFSVNLKKSMYAISAIVLSIFINICYNISFTVAFCFDINNDYSSITQNLLFIISFKVLLSITIIIVKHYNYILKDFTKYSEFTNVKNILIISLILLIVMLPSLLLMNYKLSYSTLIVFALYFSFLLQISVSITILFYFNYKIVRQKSVKLDTNYKSMSSLIDGARTIKHDLGNIFQIINGYLVAKDYDKLKIYVDSVMAEFNILNNISSLNSGIFDNAGIYGIVGSKQYLANNSGILFDLDVTVKVSEINFYKPMLCRILGILLDNALEATSKSSEKYIKLEIHYDQKKNAHIIKVYNTCKNVNDIDLNKIYDKGYSSKEEKSGIGLWEVKRIINRSKNSQIYASVENNIFVQNIIIEV